MSASGREASLQHPGSHPGWITPDPGGHTTGPDQFDQLRPAVGVLVSPVRRRGPTRRLQAPYSAFWGSGGGLGIARGLKTRCRATQTVFAVRLGPDAPFAVGSNFYPWRLALCEYCCAFEMDGGARR